MRAYQVQSADGIDAIQTIDVDDPPLGPTDVRIAVRAASLNYRDLGIVAGGYLRNDTCPVIPLSDGAGEVIEIGNEVDRWKVGDRVSPTFVRDWIDGPPTDAALKTSLGGGIDGVLGERFVSPQDALVRIPDAMSFAQAATVPCAAVTAFHALFESGNLQPGQTVLLLGTGGVSIFALQMAKSVGATVIQTSSSDEKLTRVQSMGADHVVNYAGNPEWHRAVREITDGRGVDHVVEVGGPGTLERSLKSTAVGGHVHLIGVLDSPAAKVSPMLAVFNLLTIRGIYVGSRQMHEKTIAHLAKHTLAPEIDRTFDFAEAKSAYHHLRSQKHLGKVVIEFPS